MTALECAAAALLGALVGLGELAGRYRSFRREAIVCVPGLLYVAVNAAASVVAVALIGAFGWRFGLPADARGAAVGLVTVLVGGFGAMALLRSTLFTYKQGDTVVEAGPGAALAALRDVLESTINERHAGAILRGDLLRGLDFTRHHATLTLLCTAALTGLDPTEADRLGALGANLEARADITEADKLRAFAAQLVRAVGRVPVETAAHLLRDSAENPEPGAVTVDGRPANSGTPGSPEPRGGLPSVDTGWRAAQALTEMIRTARDGFESTEDLELLRADRLLRADAPLGWLAYDSCQHPVARLLLGSSMAVNDPSPEFGLNLVNHVLQRERAVRTALIGPVTVDPAEPPIYAPWVYADAFLAVARCIPDNTLATKALDASLRYEHGADAYLFRALLRLRAGEPVDAAVDLARVDALDECDLGLREVYRPLVPLIADDAVTDELWWTLWRAALGAWELRIDGWAADRWIPVRGGRQLIPRQSTKVELRSGTNRVEAVTTLLKGVVDLYPPRSNVRKMTNVANLFNQQHHAIDASIQGENHADAHDPELVISLGDTLRLKAGNQAWMDQATGWFGDLDAARSEGVLDAVLQGDAGDVLMVAEPPRTPADFSVRYRPTILAPSKRSGRDADR